MSRGQYSPGLPYPNDVDHPELMQPQFSERRASRPNNGVPQNDHEVHQSDETRQHSCVTSPEPTQTNAEGHYIGPSSGLSSLIRAQKCLRRAISLPSNTSIFTFGDAPLPAVDSSFLILPEKAAALDLIAVYFDFAFPTHRFLHRPTIHKWVDELYASHIVVSDRGGSKARSALVFMAMAQAKLYVRTGPADEIDVQGR